MGRIRNTEIREITNQESVMKRLDKKVNEKGASSKTKKGQSRKNGQTDWMKCAGLKKLEIVDKT